MTPSQTPALPAVGDVVAGKYRIERLLGKGGMGAVFAAHHEMLQQSVAIKVMLAEYASSQQAVGRFLNEARAAARIEGEHVARVLDVGQLETGAPFIALELLDGADLEEVLTQRGRLPVAETADYVLQALEALAQAHALGIVHRDLKPANLFLARRRDGTTLVKVLDFGIAKAMNPLQGITPSGITATSSLLGSPGYMAPEQLRNAKAVDVRADLWAIGVITYELLSGRNPFFADTVGEVFVAILEKPAIPLRAVAPDVSPELEAVVMRCLAKDPAERFASVSELALALGGFAPPHARPLVERVARVQAGGVGPGPAGSQPALPYAPTVSTGASVPTAAPWSSTKPGGRGRVASAAFGGLVVGCAGVALAITLVRARSATAPSTVAASPVTLPIASAPPPPAPPAALSAGSIRAEPSAAQLVPLPAPAASSAAPPRSTPAPRGAPATRPPPRSPSTAAPPPAPSPDLFDTPK